MLVMCNEIIVIVVYYYIAISVYYRFTARITELMHVLDDLNKGKYQRTMVTDSRSDSQNKLANLKPGSGKVRHQDYVIK